MTDTTLSRQVGVTSMNNEVSEKVFRIQRYEREMQIVYTSWNIRHILNL